MRQTKIHLTLVTTTVLGLVVTAMAIPPGYTVTDLGTLADMATMPTALNNLAQVVGWSRLPTKNNESRAFLWENGVMADLGVLQGEQSLAKDINDSGLIVGLSYGQGCYWQGTDGPYLVPGLGSNSYAYGVSDSGLIVGINGRLGFLVENGEYINLGSLTNDYSFAADVNNQRQVVGWSNYGDFDQMWKQHAFLWEDAQMTDLGALGGRRSRAHKVNNNGLIVGWADTTSSTVTDIHACAWLTDGTAIDLGTLGGHNSSASSLNEIGLVVGSAETESSEEHAFVWENGIIHDRGL